MPPRITKEDLLGLQPECDAFVGIDSDGCVFDTMGVKQRTFFHPLILKHWNLQPAESALRETAEFVNLSSVWRGSNRFVALLKTFELFNGRSDVQAMDLPLPCTRELRAYVESGVPLGHPTLEAEAERPDRAELRRVLEWSRAVNHDISSRMEAIPPFPHVRECLELLRGRADVLVVSQTPEEALIHEWTRHGLSGWVRAIAGQELGTKTEHLALATGGRYARNRVLLIGDALGDWKAARESQALFFPILPGAETESWARFQEEGLDRFLDGQFEGLFQDRLIIDFRARLPDRPSWQTV